MQNARRKRKRHKTMLTQMDNYLQMGLMNFQGMRRALPLLKQMLLDPPDMHGQRDLHVIAGTETWLDPDGPTPDMRPGYIWLGKAHKRTPNAVRGQAGVGFWIKK
jgi:hypothetical protein